MGVEAEGEGGVVVEEEETEEDEGGLHAVEVLVGVHVPEEEVQEAGVATEG